MTPKEVSGKKDDVLETYTMKTSDPEGEKGDVDQLRISRKS